MRPDSPKVYNLSIPTQPQTENKQFAIFILVILFSRASSFHNEVKEPVCRINPPSPFILSTPSCYVRLTPALFPPLSLLHFPTPNVPLPFFLYLLHLHTKSQTSSTYLFDRCGMEGGKGEECWRRNVRKGYLMSPSPCRCPVQFKLLHMALFKHS